MWTGGAAAAPTPSLVRFGIFSVAANGDITLIASTANDTTLLAAQNTLYTKALQASFNKVAGQRYAYAPLVVSGATMPQYLGTSPGGSLLTSINTVWSEAPRITGTIQSLTDLPAGTTAAASIGLSSHCLYAELLQ